MHKDLSNIKQYTWKHVFGIFMMLHNYNNIHTHIIQAMGVIKHVVLIKTSNKLNKNKYKHVWGHFS